MSYIQQGTPIFRKTSFAFFAAGFNTFAILYCVQPLMPAFSKEFNISPTSASLSLSITTILLAVSMLIFGSLSEVWGRKQMMVISMFAASILCIVTAFSPNFEFLMVMRTIEGIALAGLPSIAMAYLGEEIEPKSLPAAFGLYICGNSLGAVFGRIFSGVVGDYFSWHVAVGGIGVISFLATLIFWRSLPPSKNFHAREMEFINLGKSLLEHVKNPGLVCLFGIGFLILGTNVALFNYIAYALLGDPYNLSQSLVSWIFLIMFIGMFSSVISGRLIDKFGQQKVLQMSLLLALVGVLTTLGTALVFKILGLGLFIFGFFVAHSIASSSVGQRAKENKAQASSLYLFLYYIGGSVTGTIGGMFWSSFGWVGVTGLNAGLILLAFFLSVRLSKMPVSSVKSAKAAKLGNSYKLVHK